MKRHRDVVGTDVANTNVEIEFGLEGVLAVYFRFSTEPVARTIESDEPDVLIDVDAKRRLVGVEMVNPATVNMKRVLRSVATRYKLEPLQKLSRESIEKLEELVAAG
jgi:uncharacterized protein YuzE